MTGRVQKRRTARFQRRRRSRRRFWIAQFWRFQRVIHVLNTDDYQHPICIPRVGYCAMLTMLPVVDDDTRRACACCPVCVAWLCYHHHTGFGRSDIAADCESSRREQISPLVRFRRRNEKKCEISARSSQCWLDVGMKMYVSCCTSSTSSSQSYLNK